MNYKEKTSRVFNKFFSSFLKDIKEVDDDLRKLVKSSYKAIDKSSLEYCKFFSDNLISSSDTILPKLIQGDFDEEVKSKLVGIDISIGTIFEKLQGKKEEETIIMNYIYTMTLFAYMNILEDEDELFTQVVKILGYIQSKSYEEYENEKDDIIDDDIKGLLTKIKEYEVSPKIDISETDGSGGTATDTSMENDIFSAFGDSKIASLAKEISKDIDVSSLKTDNPDDMLKNMLNFGSENNVLGNIIQKVSSTLNNKISNGELKHEDLLGEAMSMMNLFGQGGNNNPFASNPLFSQMFSQTMKSMKNGKVNIRQDVIKKGDARERLRKKLEQRKKNVE